ncbi:extracellular solute-binding protein [Candidatus Bipolaricaulota bacterium]|nr:extracellular solute-binding protein [Candidatus Bipolaricaulota bacterium]
MSGMCADERHTIIKGSSTPIYRQLKEIIREKIEQGEFKPGERIPTEYELCERFSISRTSVRQALAELTQEGYLYRQQGSGTFVSSQEEAAVTVRVLLPEVHWVPSLRRAANLASAAGGTRIKLDVEVLGRPHLHANILSAVGRGRAPDLALIDWPWVPEFADLQFLTPLDRLDPEWAQRFKADLFPALVNPRSRYLYGAQPEANVSVIWYRKDLFAAAELAPPTTWDELVRVCSRFKRDYKFPLVFAGGRAAGETTTYQLLPFLWSAGGWLVRDGRVGLGEGAVRAVSFLVDLVHRYRVVPPDVVEYPWDRAARMFAAGEAVLAVGGSYEKPLLQEVSGWDEEEFRTRVGCIPVPAGPGGRTATVAGGMVYVIFRQSRAPLAALAVLKQVVSPPLMREFCTKTGRSPTLLSVVRKLDPAVGWFSRRVAELLPHAQPRLDIPEYARVSEQFQLMVENALSRRMSPEDAVARAREIVRALIAGKRE